MKNYQYRINYGKIISDCNFFFISLVFKKGGGEEEIRIKRKMTTIMYKNILYCILNFQQL